MNENDDYRCPTPELVARTARELAAERGGWSASVAYLGAVAEAEIRGVNVAAVIMGNAQLVVAYREIIGAADGGPTCADLAGWLLHPDWSVVIERAGVLAAVERIAAEAGLEAA